MIDRIRERIRHASQAVSWCVLMVRALLSPRKTVSTSGFGTVTCTTYPARQWAFLIALDSVARGELRPRRMLLFLDRPTYGKGRLPLPIRAAVRRGVEVALLDADDGSYKKLPVFAWSPDNTPFPILTMDDDVIYPPDWLSRLRRFAIETPDTVLCYRGRRIKVRPDGSFAPYAGWLLAEDTTPRLDLLPTGVGGVLYPRSAVLAIQARGTGFREVARNMDDLWFRFCALEKGIPACQVLAKATSFTPIPYSQVESLYDVNVRQNDAALERLRHLFDLTALSANHGGAGHAAGQ